MIPRVFALHRVADATGVSGTGTVAHGVQFADGAVVIRWLGDNPSTVVWSDLDAAMRIHGHNGATQVVWLTGGDDAISRVIVERDRLIEYGLKLKDRAEAAERNLAAMCRLVEDALHLCQHGENAPGGNETWSGWALAAEQRLRRALDGREAPF